MVCFLIVITINYWQNGKPEDAKSDGNVCNIENARPKRADTQIQEIYNATVIDYTVNQISETATQNNRQGYGPGPVYLSWFYEISQQGNKKNTCQDCEEPIAHIFWNSGTQT